MAKPPSSEDQPDDSLALFGAESDRPARKAVPNAGRPPEPQPTVRDAEPVDPQAGKPTNVVFPTADAFTRMTALKSEPAYPATRDLGVEFVGPPPPKGSVSFDHVCAVKGLGFVEGVALIQAAAAAADAADSGVPDPHGLFLTSRGDVLVNGAPTGEPPARELTRLLHQLVDPTLMPPAGRLFVGRWINSEAGSLTEFRSELEYFARPNGRDLLIALHGRCEGVAAPLTEAQRQRRETPKQPAERDARDRSKAPIPPILVWIQSHKRALATGLAIIVAAVSLTAAATLLMAPGTAAASKGSAAEAENSTNLDDEATSRVANSKGPRPGTGKNGGGSRSASRNRQAAAAVPLAKRRTANSQMPPSAIQSQDTAGAVAEASSAGAAAAALSARAVPDLRIYSVSDTGIEPPRLRSAEILELLISGFEKRTNEIELVISEKGEVQHARMTKVPQRMPDIMLLSRTKELLFDPAMRNGVPVRYRLVLSWNVTP
jgi:hypothetical protein